MRYVRVEVDREDSLTKISNLVLPWEVPVLQAMYPPGAVRVVNDADGYAERTVDGAEGEYKRLLERYGDDDNGVSFVARAFGAGHIGVQALAKMMQETQAPTAGLLS